MRMRTATIVALAVLLTVAAGRGLAMSSASFRLDWYVPLTGGAGAPAQSPQYAINYTVGQTSIEASSSAGYRAFLGFWHGIGASCSLYLPLVMK